MLGTNIIKIRKDIVSCLELLVVFKDNFAVLDFIIIIIYLFEYGFGTLILLDKFFAYHSFVISAVMFVISGKIFVFK